MGGSSSSPRSITIEEKNSGVVKVSEAVARRLVGKPETPDSTGDEAQARITVNRMVPEEDLRTELDDMRSRYENKVKALEKQNREVHQTSVEEFAKAVEDVEKKFVKPITSPICDDLQNKIIQCYKDNPKQVLTCSEMVRAYTACVEHERGNVLKNSGNDFILVP